MAQRGGQDPLPEALQQAEQAAGVAGAEGGQGGRAVVWGNDSPAVQVRPGHHCKTLHDL
jgi:hypothetical protein